MPSPIESSYISSVSELIEFFDDYIQRNFFFSKEVVAAAVKNYFALSICLRHRSIATLRQSP
jgi:hypothetical protein